jgi:hypothetical protein
MVPAGTIYARFQLYASDMESNGVPTADLYVDKRNDLLMSCAIDAH